MFRAGLKVLSRQWERLMATAGPSSEHLRAVPFTRSLEEARAAYDSYHQSVISYIPSWAPSVKESFLPFWAVSSIANVEIRSAQVGHRRLRTTYDYRSRRPVTVVQMEWQTVVWEAYNRPYWERIHNADKDLAMQIYASYDYSRADVNGLRSESCFRGAKRLTADMVEKDGGGVRGLEEFRMRPSAALEIAKASMRRQAELDARDVLMKMFAASDVQQIDLEIVISHLAMAPVYVPAFIFETQYMGEQVKTFVHGSTLAVGGQRLYHAPLVAIAGGTAAAAVTGYLTGSVNVATIIMCGAIAGAMALLLPVLSIRFREWWRVREEKSHTWSFFGDWGQEYVKAYGMWEEKARQEQTRRRRIYEEQQRFREEQRRQQQEQAYRAYEQWYGFGGYQQDYSYRQRQQQQQQQQQQTYRSPDPKGYYAALGLSPGASEAEVKAAFKSLALKHHPDRYHDPKEIDRAKDRFQKISAAYQVLRDPNKKRIYDQTGTD